MAMNRRDVCLFVMGSAVITHLLITVLGRKKTEIQVQIFVAIYSYICVCEFI